jgi:hypothetical protein
LSEPPTERLTAKWTTPTTSDPIQPGNYVRHRTWTPEHVGTVVSIFDDDELSVTWHGHMANDQIHPDEVEKLTEEEKAAYIAAWPAGKRA